MGYFLIKLNQGKIRYSPALVVVGESVDIGFSLVVGASLVVIASVAAGASCLITISPRQHS